jgi:hypothetical protein
MRNPHTILSIEGFHIALSNFNLSMLPVYCNALLYVGCKQNYI